MASFMILRNTSTLVNRSLCCFSRHSSYNSLFSKSHRQVIVPLNYETKRFQNTQKNESKQPPNLRQKLKDAVAQYGSTVIVFHVAISLVSLGIFYVLVSSGLDIKKMLKTLGFGDERTERIVANAGTFAVAYAVHKLFAPVRITVTLTSVPFIVRYLRRIGMLKKRH